MEILSEADILKTDFLIFHKFNLEKEILSVADILKNDSLFFRKCNLEVEKLI
jgi:hypothetical protein